jgi:2-C-methyl-D-erythritol 4-phosphate cytidylyltransferase
MVRWMRTVAVVLAGGSGQRAGGQLPKQLQLLAGRTLVEHCVAAFEQAPGVAEILVVMPAVLAGQTAGLLGRRYRKLRGVIAGGQDRAGSVRLALGELAGQHPDANVLLHDAARPLVDQRIIADCVAGLANAQAVGVVLPASDTIVQLTGGVMAALPPRDQLGHCQTPQGFRLSVIAEAHRRAGADPVAGPATDDCGLVLRYLPDVRVAVVTGSTRNMKITYPGDLEIAELLLTG